MKLIRTEEHNRARVVHVHETGKEPEIRVAIGERVTLTMQPGEAATLRDDLTRAIQRGGPEGHALMACTFKEESGKPCTAVANTLVGGKAYCDEHAKKAAR